MKLSKNSLHYKWYKLLYWKDGYSIEIDNFCNYFWSLLMGTLLSPFVLLVPFGRKGYYDPGANVIFRAALGAIFTLIGGLVLWYFYNLLFHYTWQLLSPMLLIIGAVGVIVLLLWIISKLAEKKEWETMDVIVEGYKSWKDKYCPKIDWKDDIKA